MFDDTPITLEEVIDHCRALIYAIVTLEPPEAKETLSFVLQQQIDLLYYLHEQNTLLAELDASAPNLIDDEALHTSIEAAKIASKNALKNISTA
ncbi:hypothetical protein MNY64_12060 [Moellerella wisconsensis]|uniref:hypothetical protein n=1 Tax=Moellerella wisconsensis TaxID=158849 RepID=UPI001F4E38F4|nr:hypothetical protein [Moellerella wisconsensis]UNH28903.1 hypothetical protein MNY64_12060 [Moellerella wisconsensis]